MCAHHVAARLSPSISVLTRRSSRSSIVLSAADVKAGQSLTSPTKEPDVPAHVIQRLQQLEAEVQKAYQSGYNAGYTAGVKVTVNVDLSRTSSSKKSSRSKPTSDSSSGQTSGSSTSNGSSGSGAQLEGSSAQSENTSSNGAGSSKVSTQPNEQHQQQEQQSESKGQGLIETPAASASAVDVGDSILRSAVKGLVWRLFSTTVTVSIALLLLHDVLQVEDALKLGALEFTAKFLMYCLHERMWAMLPIK